MPSADCHTAIAAVTGDPLPFVASFVSSTHRGTRVQIATIRPAEALFNRFASHPALLPTERLALPGYSLSAFYA